MVEPSADASALRAELARALIDSRRRLELTQAELAELSGTTLGQVLRVEAETSPAYLDRLVALLDSCGLELRVERRSNRPSASGTP